MLEVKKYILCWVLCRVFTSFGPLCLMLKSKYFVDATFVQKLAKKLRHRKYGKKSCFLLKNKKKYNHSVPSPWSFFIHFCDPMTRVYLWSQARTRFTFPIFLSFGENRKQACRPQSYNKQALRHRVREIKDHKGQSRSGCTDPGLLVSFYEIFWAYCLDTQFLLKITANLGEALSQFRTYTCLYLRS